jgi:hypothetical protein
MVSPADSANGSERDVPPPGPRNSSRPALLALVLLVWLSSPLTVTRAPAAGCHVPERPVLAAPLSRERGTLTAWQITDLRPAAPPVLTRLPCPGEVPQVPGVPIAAIAPVSRSRREIAPLPRRESRSTADDISRIDPHPSRLDRPPRCR